MTITQLRQALERYDAAPRREAPVTVVLATVGASCMLISAWLAHHDHETAFRWLFLVSFGIGGAAAYTAWQTTLKIQKEVGLICPCCRSHLYPAFTRLHIIDGYCPSAGGRVIEDEPMPLDDLWTLRSLSCHTPEQFAALEAQQKKDSVRWLAGGIGLLLLLIAILYFGKLPEEIDHDGITRFIWSLIALVVFMVICFGSAWVYWPRSELPPHRQQPTTETLGKPSNRTDPSGCMWILKGFLERYGQVLANLTLSFRFWVYIGIIIILWRMFH